MKKYHQISETIGCTGPYETGIYKKTLSSLPDMHKMISILPVMLLAITFVFLPLADSLQAQERVRFSHLTTTDGLSQSTGRVIIQDYEGYMWFGTLDGLNRYNGHDVTVYNQDPDDPFSVNYNEISALFKDSWHNLWIGTLGGGINLYDRDLDRFTHYTSDETRPPGKRLSHNSVYTISEDPEGNIWAGTDEGVNILNPQTGIIQHVQTDQGDENSLSNNNITVIYRDRKDTMWVGTQDGLNQYDSSSGQFDRFLQHSGETGATGAGHIKTIYEDGERFWIGTQGGGLILFDRESGAFQSWKYNPGDPGSLSDNSVFAILRDSRGQLWIGTENGGLSIMDEESNRFYHYQQNLNDPTSINNNAIYSIYESRDQILWAGTYNGGINFTDRKPLRFEHYKHDPYSEQSLSINSVISFTDDREGNIWIGTDGGGLNKFDPESGDVTTVYRQRDDPLNAPSSDIILALETAEDGSIWIGTYREGLNRFDPGTGKFEHFRHRPGDPTGINHDEIFGIHIDSENPDYLWLATNGGGINKMDIATGETIHYMHDPSDPESLDNNFVRTFYEDSEGSFWVGHYGGFLSSLDKENGIFTSYDMSDLSLYSNAVQVIHEDEQGRFWLATRGGGLKLFDRNDFTIKSFSERDGLANNTVHAIQDDGRGYLWLSTNQGISRFNKETKLFTDYSLDDGLQSLEFNANSSFRDRDGYLYFGGVSGFNRFHPEDIKANTDVPPVVLTGLRIFNRPVEIGDDSPLQHHISRKEEITLPWHQSVLTFEFVSLNYNLNKGEQFAYRLDGFDHDWNYVGDQKTATYTNLPHGTYTFRVRAANSDGVWSEADTSVGLVITPPFWKTIWFYLLSFIVFGLIVTGAYRYKVRLYTYQNKKLEEEVKRQTSELFEKNRELEHTLTELKTTRSELIDKAHKAGMADLATNVLHNVGNILNSVNVSTTLIDQVLNRSRIKKLAKANELLRENMENLEEFILHDPRGRKLLEYNLKLEEAIKEEHQQIMNEKDRLRNNIKLIMDVVSAQQSFSKTSRIVERVSLNKVVEDTLMLQAGSINRHDLQIEKEIEEVGKVEVEKTKLIHILINLFNNAKEAMEGMKPEDKKLFIRIWKEDGQICLSIRDTGSGIDPEIRKKIFNHGFTTKKEGHGFGLHSCANYMQEIGGSMEVESEGQGKGAIFTLRYPVSGQKSNGQSVKGSPSEIIDVEG